MNPAICKHQALSKAQADKALFELWLAMTPLVNACPVCLANALKEYERNEPSVHRVIRAGIDKLDAAGAIANLGEA